VRNKTTLQEDMMLYKILYLIQEALKYGIGQAFIAFGAWLYVLILIIVAVYYTFLSIIKFFSETK
jgi:hypothetical protein